jgi:hypothetical protein
MRLCQHQCISQKRLSYPLGSAGNWWYDWELPGGALPSQNWKGHVGQLHSEMRDFEVVGVKYVVKPVILDRSPVPFVPLCNE